jgi:hypothetical protein
MSSGRPRKQASKRLTADFPELSTDGLSWPRVRISEELGAAISKNWPVGESAGALEKAGYLRRPDRLGEFHGFLRFESGGSYDPSAAYDLATEKRNSKLSPHTALRSVWRARDVLDFLAYFGPLLNGFPHVVYESEDRRGRSLIDLGDFERRQKCYAAVVRLYDALHDRDRLVQEWRGVAVGARDLVRGGFPIIRWVKRAPSGLKPNGELDRPPGFFSVNTPDETFELANIESPIEPGQPAFSKWVDKAPAEQLRAMAERVILLAVQKHAGTQVVWSVRHDQSGLPTFRPTVRSQTLWSEIWSFFAADTNSGALWRLCPHCKKIFWPPRLDRYFCTPRLQQLHSKREWARKHR